MSSAAESTPVKADVQDVSHPRSARRGNPHSGYGGDDGRLEAIPQDGDARGFRGLIPDCELQCGG